MEIIIKKSSGRKIIPGNFVNKHGDVMGTHKGIVYYTIGQRKGLGIAVGKPVFVNDINPLTNQIVLGDEEDIFKTGLIAKDLNFILFDSLQSNLRVSAKIRYSAKPQLATLIPLENNRVKVVFDEKQRAITKGQSVVFYLENLVVGGGIIEEIL